MVKPRSKRITVIKIGVSTTQADIDEGKCRLIHRCMEKLALVRALIEQLGLSEGKMHRLHVRVDAGHIRFNYDGYRWQATTPQIAKNALIAFDAGRPVKPHRYTIVAERKDKITSMTVERMQQINEARRRRAIEGRPDKTYDDPIRKRVIGYVTDHRGGSRKRGHSDDRVTA